VSQHLETAPTESPPRPDDDLELPDDWGFDLTTPAWNRDVVEVLQGFLAQAKRGEVTDIAVTGVLRTGAVSTAFAGGGQRIKLVAGANYLLARLVAE